MNLAQIKMDQIQRAIHGLGGFVVPVEKDGALWVAVSIFAFNRANGVIPGEVDAYSGDDDREVLWRLAEAEVLVGYPASNTKKSLIGRFPKIERKAWVCAATQIAWGKFAGLSLVEQGQRLKLIEMRLGLDPMEQARLGVKILGLPVDGVSRLSQALTQIPR